MAVAPSVPINVARGLQFMARKLSDGLPKSGGSAVYKIVKQSDPVEYWNGSTWVTDDPGNQTMTADTTFPDTFEDSYTLDEGGVDYIIRAWDPDDNDVAVLTARVRGASDVTVVHEMPLELMIEPDLAEVEMEVVEP